MSRDLKVWVALAWLTLPVFGRAQDRSAVTISVHNYADVSAKTLAKAEAEARRIFQQAGISTIWLNCSPSLQRGENEPSNCLLVDSTHLVLKVLQTAKDPELNRRIDVLGDAFVLEKGTSFYAYAYYGRIKTFTEYGSIEYALLAGVFTHEIGHLLLQSGSHSPTGIMCPHWSDKELRQISRGTMYFTPPESRMMQAKVEQLRLSTNQEGPLSTVGP